MAADAKCECGTCDWCLTRRALLEFRPPPHVERQMRRAAEIVPPLTMSGVARATREDFRCLWNEVPVSTWASNKPAAVAFCVSCGQQHYRKGEKCDGCAR